MSKSDIVVQLEKEKQRQINAEAREKYWRDKFDQESLEVEEQDHNDLSAMLLGKSVNNMPEELHSLWNERLKMVQKKGYRRHPK